MLAIYTSYCSQEVLQPAGRNWSISGIEAPLAGNFLFPIVRIDDKHLNHLIPPMVCHSRLSHEAFMRPLLA